MVVLNDLQATMEDAYSAMLLILSAFDATIISAWNALLHLK